MATSTVMPSFSPRIDTGGLCSTCLLRSRYLAKGSTPPSQSKSEIFGSRGRSARRRPAHALEVALRLAAVEAQEVLPAVAPDMHVELFGQRIDDGGADAVQAA